MQNHESITDIHRGDTVKITDEGYPKTTYEMQDAND